MALRVVVECRFVQLVLVLEKVVILRGWEGKGLGPAILMEEGFVLEIILYTYISLSTNDRKSLDGT